MKILLIDDDVKLVAKRKVGLEEKNIRLRLPKMVIRGRS
jgi:hypothetical protein